jgi:hypothetical protein
MHRDRRDRLTRTWLLLLVLTMGSLALAHAGWATPAIAATALGAAAVKAWRIALDFLELRAAPVGWRTAVAAWIVLIAGGAWAGAILSLLLA